VAERVHGAALTGFVFVPPGGSYAEAMPMWTLRSAA
jgi:hypothetical protein